MAWFWLILGGVFEVGFTTSLRFVDGFKNVPWTLAFLVSGWGALMWRGPQLVSWWTAGNIRPDPVVFALLATAALCHGAWLSAANLLFAVNRQATFGLCFLVVAALTCGSAAALGWRFGLAGIATAALAGEVAMMVLILPAEIRVAVRQTAMLRGAKP